MAKGSLKIPNHVAIIMDGNGRWANQRGLPRIEGHKAGAKVVKNIVEEAKNIGVKYLSLYAFSTENWKRPIDEVLGLFQILDTYLEKEVPTMIQNGIRFRVAGRWKELPDFVVSKISWAISETKEMSTMDFILCLNYGGRAEILDVVRSILRDKRNLKVDDIDEEFFRKHMYLPDVPDVDLLIRTSGEKRISNFLLWHIAYAELYFTPVMWPDFTSEDFKEAIADYNRRDRRFGGIKDA